MNDWVWWITSITNTTTNTIGVTANVFFLICVIFKKTPQQLATYSVIFFDTALCDLFACSTALLVRQRTIPSGMGIYFIFNGPCTLSGPSACYFMYGFVLHLHSHAVWGILFSFAYRYYIIGRPPPSEAASQFFLFSSICRHSFSSLCFPSPPRIAT
uniref:G protein-coupled receptor n=1 Tax=Haemonchus contortus TaxID=6289 RepID=A0A7I4YWS7_HAECO